MVNVHLIILGNRYETGLGSTDDGVLHHHPIQYYVEGWCLGKPPHHEIGAVGQPSRDDAIETSLSEGFN